jgi:hypothetical protein
MKFIRKLFFCLITALLVWLGIFTYNRLTDGFSIYQMSSSLPPAPEFDTPLSVEKKEYLQTLLDQKFYYIGKGCQFYVFESEDGKYVIKFLKHKHLRQFTWLNALPMPPKLRQLCDAKIARRSERVKRLFTSCQIAYEKMPEEAGLLFIHLNRVPALEKNITLIDKIGCKHTIAIDEYEYFVQKKGITLREIFSNIEEKDVPKKVQLLLDLVLKRCEKGICDRDRAFVQNIAFTENGQKAIFIDFGQFYENPSILQKEEQTKDLEKRMINLRAWTEIRFPAFADSIPHDPHSYLVKK